MQMFGIGLAVGFFVIFLNVISSQGLFWLCGNLPLMGTFHRLQKLIQFLAGLDPDRIHVFLIYALRLLLRLLCTWF